MSNETADISTRLKNTELEMLCAFRDACEKMGLRYFLAEGTLLGAVRHKGFIPWDDDIDVCMPRKDYDRFLAEGKQYLPEHLFIQTHETDPEYPHNFAKIRNSRTTYIETFSRYKEMNHGIFIDVFPEDYYPYDPWKARIFEFKKVLLTYRIYDAFYMPDLKLKGRDRILKGLADVMYPSLETAIRRQHKLYTSVKTSNLVCNLCSAWGKREIMPGEWMETQQDVEFEGQLFKGPAEPDLYLSKIYGDYMKLPPVEKRVSPHNAEIIDPDRPYTEYSDSYGEGLKRRLVLQ